MNVLIIAPHPDDEAIGCGGTICLNNLRGNRVSALFLSSGEQGLRHLPPEKARTIREREAQSAAEILGINSMSFLRLPDLHVEDNIDQAIAGLRRVLQQESPERIYMPHPHDSHPDHRICLPVVRAALRHGDTPMPSLLTYEVWTPLLQYDDGEDITAVISRKVKAIRCHRSQVKQLRYDRAVKGLNQYRGALAWKCDYAEIFQHENIRDDATSTENLIIPTQGYMHR